MACVEEKARPLKWPERTDFLKSKYKCESWWLFCYGEIIIKKSQKHTSEILARN